MLQKKIIIANWKMNFGVKESVDFVSQLLDSINNQETKDDVVICASFTALDALNKFLENSKVFLGAQNVGEAREGTWTGEVSALMLKEVGCGYVIVGHSERREKLGETDSQVNSKIKLVMENGMIPILCVGETRSERENKLTNSKVSSQLEQDLEGVQVGEGQEVIVAYEPIWSISDGKNPSVTPTVEEIEEVHKLIIKILVDKYSQDKVENLFRVIYGASVHSKNINDIFSSEYVQGGLVGGASLKIDEFLKMVKR
jgi:triosephosphate isomerase